MPRPVCSVTIRSPAALPGIAVLFGRVARGGTAGGFFSHYAVSARTGAIRYHRRGKQYEHSGSCVTLIDGDEFVPISACGDTVFRSLCFAPDLMRRAAEERGLSQIPHFAPGVVQDPRLHRFVVQAILNVAQAKEALEREEAATTLLDMVLGQYVDGGRLIGDVIAHRGVRRMRDLIQDCYSRELRLDTLASVAHLNKFYALRAFKRAMGVTPHEYQRRLRVSKACQMLRAGQSCTEVAHALGFCDQSHFVRTFHQLVFTTPRHFQISI